jgi:hypothetical protein
MSHFPSTQSFTEPVLMRRATAADAARIATVARLDDRRLPSGPFLVAEIADEIVAALSLSSGAVIADPFRPTADTVAMLRLRAAQLGTTGEPATRRARHARGTAPRSFGQPAAAA